MQKDIHIQERVAVLTTDQFVQGCYKTLIVCGNGPNDSWDIAVHVYKHLGGMTTRNTLEVPRSHACSERTKKFVLGTI